MKLILLIILIIFGFQSSAWGQAPTLSIEAKQEPIQEIMKKIEEKITDVVHLSTVYEISKEELTEILNYLYEEEKWKKRLIRHIDNS